MPLPSSADAPLPLRTVSKAIGDWVGRLGRVWVEGQITEISRRPGMSVVFLVLRDPVADVSAPMRCDRRLCDAMDPPLATGMRIAAWVKPEFHLTRGSLSLTAFEIRPLGLGLLLARIERLKSVLAAEGLFAPDRKLPLPFLPDTVGLITGRASAAERDVCENAARRWPAVRFRTVPVAVQGPTAVTAVIDALRNLDADPAVEVIVVARGGGSVEDLLPFSDEALLRTVAACRTPVVSAIGHEPDSPLLDFVADRRASTPTDAGKIVVPDVLEEQAAIQRARTTARRLLLRRLEREQDRLDAWRRSPALAAPERAIALRQTEITGLQARARRCFSARLDRAQDDLLHTQARITALSPAATLQRGYAVVQRDDGSVVRQPGEVTGGDALRIWVTGGQFSAVVQPPRSPSSAAGK